MRFLIIAVLLAACEPQPPPSAQESPVEVEVEVEYVDAGPPDAPDVVSVDMGSVVAEYSTRYGSLGSKASRAKNVELAASRIDGKVLSPGDSFSFNALVGPRSKEEGFLMAPILWDGETASDVGGGVCQVSSTLHAAVLKAGIVPTFRRPHSRHSSYIPPGMDATVAYSPECGGLTNTAMDGGAPGCWSMDFTFDNPFPFPVGIVALVRDVKEGVRELKVVILGGDPPGDVVIARSVSSGEPFLQEFRRGRRLKDEETRRVQRGKDGSTVRTFVTIAGPGGKSKKTVHKSYYKPVNEIWEVGPDYDMEGPPPWEPREVQDAGAPDAETEQRPDAG